MKKLLLLALLISHSALALPAVPPQPVSDELTLYNACTGTWFSTGLPYRENPDFDHEVTSQKYFPFKKTYDGTDRRLELYKVDLFNIEKHVKVGGSNLPKSLRGIWWMDGNPVPEVVLSFADAQYDVEAKLIVNRYNGPNGYLITPSVVGNVWWDLTVLLQPQLKLNLKEISDVENPSFGERMLINVGLKHFGEVPTEWPATYISDQLWRRDTNQHCYNLRQIVDENGNKLPTYDYFVKQVQKQTKDLLGWNPDVLLQAIPVE